MIDYFHHTIAFLFPCTVTARLLVLGRRVVREFKITLQRIHSGIGRISIYIFFNHYAYAGLNTLLFLFALLWSAAVQFSINFFFIIFFFVSFCWKVFPHFLACDFYQWNFWSKNARPARMNYSCRRILYSTAVYMYTALRLLRTNVGK